MQSTLKNINTRSNTFSSKGSFQCALIEWKTFLADQQIIIENIPNKYINNTIHHDARPKAVLKLNHKDEVAKAIKIAQAYGVVVYPISTGNNWGYGSSSAISEQAVIFDLSGMNRITFFDSENGLVTLQPGVTQQMLYDFLQNLNSPFMVPVTGAGPHCSLVGNALERGYGITPKTDHFAAVMAIEAILPNGEEYCSSLKEWGGREVSGLHKWGVGPYLDGIFSQSNLAIVTEMTIELQKKPEQIEFFCFQVFKEDQLGDVVEKIRETLEKLGHHLSGVNILNAERILAMSAEYPYEEIQRCGREQTVSGLFKKLQIAPWTCVGAIYGTKRVSKAVKKEIKEIVKGPAKRLVFINRNKMDFIKKIYQRIPFKIDFVSNFLDKVSSTLDILEGKPNRIALPLAYWKNRQKNFDVTQENPNPALDRCGLIWFTPLLPLKSNAISTYSEILQRVCLKYGIEPLMTITTLSEKVADSSVPLLFDQSNEVECENARRCYLELFEECKSHGFLPYRLGVNQMQLYTNEKSNYFDTVAKIKNCLDPNHILAPGRYCHKP